MIVCVQDALAAGGRDPDPKLQEDVFYLAGRMDDMLRACLAGSEASGVKLSVSVFLVFCVINSGRLDDMLHACLARN